MWITGSLFCLVLATFCASEEVADENAAGVLDGYTVIFRIQSRAGNASYDHFMNIGEDDDERIRNAELEESCTNGDLPINCKDMCTHNYRSGELDTIWDSISKVRVGVYKEFEEVKFFEFEAQNENLTTWFSKDNLVSSSYSDLNEDTVTNYFSIKGHASEFRRFFINKIYDNCPNDAGWLLVVDKYDKRNKGCRYETAIPEIYPRILYSSSDKVALWSEASQRDVADFVLISVK